MSEKASEISQATYSHMVKAYQQNHSLGDKTYQSSSVIVCFEYRSFKPDGQVGKVH